MPILAPSLGPPHHNSHSFLSTPASDIALQLDQKVVSPSQTMTDTNPDPERSPESTPISKIPCVTLDTDVITDAMAARLATSLLGHILFLKSQVPFPIIQLARVPGGNSNTRALKKRIDLLASFDTLTSHLQTTFTALSTAMARSTRCSNTPRKLVTQLENKFDDTGLDKGKGKKLGRAYLAIVLGPSASSAKARILFAVDGLEVKIWGQMDDTADLGCGSAGEPDEGSDGDTQSESSDEQSDSGSEFDSDSDLVDESGSSTDSIIDGSSPLPRSPSPTSSSLSDLEPSTVQRTLMSQAQSQGEDELPDSEVEAVAYASEQQTFLKAERLLSRTLAAACAEDDGRGIACELAPTQTHILLRAPRRFSHPAWTPKQNLVTTMEGVLANFLEDSGLVAGRNMEKDPVGRTKRKKGTESEGIWIRCRTDGDGEGEETKEEQDEMIWWTWDGKIVGFSDW